MLAFLVIWYPVTDPIQSDTATPIAEQYRRVWTSHSYCFQMCNNTACHRMMWHEDANNGCAVKFVSVSVATGIVIAQGHGFSLRQAV